MIVKRHWYGNPIHQLEKLRHGMLVLWPSHQWTISPNQLPTGKTVTGKDYDVRLKFCFPNQGRYKLKIFPFSFQVINWQYVILLIFVTRKFCIRPPIFRICTHCFETTLIGLFSVGIDFHCHQRILLDVVWLWCKTSVHLSDDKKGYGRKLQRAEITDIFSSYSWFIEKCYSKNGFSEQIRGRAVAFLMRINRVKRKLCLSIIWGPTALKR